MCKVQGPHHNWTHCLLYKTHRTYNNAFSTLRILFRVFIMFWEWENSIILIRIVNFGSEHSNQHSNSWKIVFGTNFLHVAPQSECSDPKVNIKSGFYDHKNQYFDIQHAVKYRGWSKIYRTDSSVPIRLDIWPWK